MMDANEMARFVALLRGVNVGRAKRVPMADWRALLESLGHTNVRTVLNSGNAVFDGRAGDPAAHARRLRAALARVMQADLPVIVKTAAEMAAVEAGNPFADVATEASRLLVAFAPDAAALQSLAPIGALVRKPERFHLGAQAAYLWCPAGILEAAAAKSLLGRAGQALTTRNWATVVKLCALVRSP